MEVHGNLNLKENDLIGAVFGIETNFPLNPRPGRFMFKDKVLFVCAELIAGVPVWVPLTKPLNLVKSSQSTPALEWTINHNLNCSFPIVQVYDSAGNVIIPDNINAGTFNSVLISFSMPTAGIAIIQRGEEEGAQQPIYAFTQGFTTQAVWVVTHNLGYNPIINCTIGSDIVQPQSIVHDSLLQTTVTFSSAQTGTVRCI